MFVALNNSSFINKKFNKKNFTNKLEKICENEESKFNKNTLNEYNQYKHLDLNDYLFKFYNSFIKFFKVHLNYCTSD